MIKITCDKESEFVWIKTVIENGVLNLRDGDPLVETFKNAKEIGSILIIEEINDFAETMTISFDEGRKVEYSYKLLEELELAYAITIHKSQGSEYPAVVIPLLSGPRMLLNRNLLYTAVTRARKCVTLVGNDETFYTMVENNLEQKRFSGLKARLMEV